MKILVKRQPLNEMASRIISEPCDAVKYDNIALEMIIFVNDSEKHHLPHMHVQVRPRSIGGVNTSPIFETCVRIDTAEYSLHSSKFKKFPFKEWRDLFIRLMLQDVTLKFRSKTIEVPGWEDAVLKWNSSMSASYIVPEDCDMPNYSMLDIDNNLSSIISQRIAELDVSK